MKTTVRYYLSATGQRNVIMLTGEATPIEQKLDIEVGNGDLELFALTSKGELQPRTLRHEENSSIWDDPKYDHLLTTSEALTELRAMDMRVAARRGTEASAAAAKTAAEKIKQDSFDSQAFAALKAAVADPTTRYEICGRRIQPTKRCLCEAWIIPEMLWSACEPLLAEMQHRNDRDNAVKTRLDKLPRVPHVIASLAAPDRGNGWSKLLTYVSPSAKDGYGYEGEWGTGSGNLGDVVIVVKKWWSGSRKHGRWESSATLYVRGASWHVARDASGKIESSDSWATQLRDRAIAFLALDPVERVRQTICARLAVLQLRISDCIPLREDDADVTAAILSRQTEIKAVAEQLRGELDSLDPDPADAEIPDLDAAALAIVSAGYRALAHKHHPDREGGNEETMKLVNEAKVQLREMLVAAKRMR